MKKITLLVLFFAVSFVQNAQSYKYHEVRDLGTTFSQANTNFCNNTLGQQIKLNIFISSPLIVGNIYFIENIDGVDKYVKITKASSRSNQDADEFVDGTNIGAPISFTCVIDSDNDGIPDSQDNCPNNANANQADLDNDGIGDVCDNQDNRDSDGDGVENHEDDCPNQAGSSSNNGCPGNPDLTIDENNTAISSACLNCASILANIGSDKYLLKPAGSSMFVDLRVKNNGTATSSQSNVQYYLSTNNTLGNTDIKFGPITNFNSISPGSHRDVNAVFDYGTISGIMGGTTGNRFILMVVDEDNFNPNELNENNNVTPIPIRVSNSSSSSLTFRLPSLSDIEETKGYQFSIYNFSGQKILTREAYNIQEENTIIEDLQKDGIYIIKSKNSTRKVYVGKD